jgi:hypothetical protein
MSRTRDRSGDIVEGDVVYWLAEPEMRLPMALNTRLGCSTQDLPIVVVSC